MVDRGVHFSEGEPEKPEGGLAADEREVESVRARKAGSMLADANSVVLVPEMRLDTAVEAAPQASPTVKPARASSFVPRA